ncbi:MAG: hypothetical protein DI536_34305 [Archangium gephyra]|uniref:MYXO-CTERM domain-containing protein n=1 Tax=Archangium gephyra TaxID=48 RepID=A0A2W5SNC3_9BACT|nr:MAG: hypothetical protein DI536_34305 [Archangium gephyra]
MLRRLALSFALLATPVVTAQELPDAGLPDASVGEGGADRDTEEADTAGGPCLTSNECTMGFSCVDARCVPAPVTNAGCSTATFPALATLGLLLLARRRA